MFRKADLYRSGFGSTAVILLALCSACGTKDKTPTAPTPPPTPPPPGVPAVSEVSVSPATATLTGLGAKVTLTAALLPANATGEISWSVSDPALASLTGSGKSATITAIAGGTTRVIARSGGKEGSSQITIVPIVRAVSITPELISLKIGEQRTVAAKVTADQGADTTLSWSIGNPAIASVSSSGELSGVAPGSTTLTATSQAFPSVSTTIPVSVSQTVVHIDLSPTAPSIQVGDTLSLIATITTDPVVPSGVTWSSANPTIVSVSNTGLLTGMAPGGPVAITARSTLIDSVTATASVTVTAPPPTGGFVYQKLGTAPYLGSSRFVPQALLSTGPAEALFSQTWNGAGASQASRLFQLAGGTLRELVPACCNIESNYHLIAGPSATDALIAIEGLQYRPGTPPATVLHLNGTALIDTHWPSGSSGFDRTLRTLDYVGNGKYLGIAASGSKSEVWEYSGGSWVQRGILSKLEDNSLVAAKAWAPDSLIAVSCDDGPNPTVIRWFGGSESFMPAPSADCEAGSHFGGILLGTRSDSLVLNFDNSLHLWNGTSWRALALPDPAAQIQSVADCRGTRYLSTKTGLVYRESGGLFTQVADEGVVSFPSDGTGLKALLSCSPDGTLRALSAGTLLARRSGNGWTEENFAPDIVSATLSSPENGFAITKGTISKLTGSSWISLLRKPTSFGTLSDLALAPDGSLVVVGRTSTGKNGILIRYNGGSFTRTEFAGQQLSAPVPLTSTSLFAIARDTNSFVAEVVRITGGTLTREPITGLAMGLAGKPNNVYAWYTDNTMRRYDGISWRTIPAPGTSSFTWGPVLEAVGDSLAFFGTCRTGSSPVEGIWRFNGSNWAITQTNLPGGLSLCTKDIFGASEESLFAIVTNPSLPGGTALLRWVGVRWEVVNVAIPLDDVTRGSALPGRVILVGKNGFAASATSLERRSSTRVKSRRK